MTNTSVVDEIQGIKIPDPYRWLEASENSDVKEWTNNQNSSTYVALKNNFFETFSDELAKNFKFVNFSAPIPVNGQYFYMERQPDQDQFVLYMKKGLDGAPVELFNPNGRREGNTASISYWNVSNTGKYVIYGISEGGDEMATLYIKDTHTNQELPEKITRCRNSAISWLSDEASFFYTRNPKSGSVPKNEEHMHTKVYLHKLGDNPDDDELIFGEGRPKDDMIGLHISPDSRFLGIQAAQKWTENEIYIYDINKKETKPLITNAPFKFTLKFLIDKVLIGTNYQANNYRALWTTYDDLYKPFEQWKEFIAEKEFPIESSTITKDKVLVVYSANACSKVFIFDYTGKEIGKLPLPKYSSITGISGRRQEEEFFYGVDSFVFPKILYRYNPTTLKYSEYRKTDNPINPENYEVKQDWFTSKDGTKIPMFIFHKKGLALSGLNPTILYGYGGFSNSLNPSFMRSWVPWIERGGIFAIANIRGGGEFGDKWHKSGMKENKQNSFDDFIAAAEYLVSKKYTDSQHLGILGGSNGGLLVSAVAVQRPELFKAVCSRVPLTDMVRFHKFGMAVRWTHEYGNPDVKEDLIRILKWSPYHNIKEGIKYPSFLFTTAENDTRVNSLHARKMAAALQGANNKNEVLLFTETEAGHGPGKPVVKFVESQALVLSFFAQKLDLKL